MLLETLTGIAQLCHLFLSLISPFSQRLHKLYYRYPGSCSNSSCEFEESIHVTVRDAILDTGLAFHGREPLRKGYSCFGHNSSQNLKVDGRVS